MKNLLVILTLLLVPALAQAQFKLNPSAGSATPSVSYSEPKEYEIAEITVSGARFLDPNALISISGLKVGDRIKVPGDDISNAIKRLWDQGILGDVRISYTKIEGDKIYLDVFLKERPRLSKFTFKGIKKGEIDALTEKIKLIRGKVVDDALVKNTQMTIKKHFEEKGFLNTSVNMVQVEDTARGNTITLRINVNKKKKVKINELAINGNEVFADNKLRRKLKKTKQKNPLRIFTPSKFIASQYEEDKKKLIAFYNEEGYRDALIVSDSVYAHDENTINVVINLEEGEKYHYRNVTWEGNYVYTDTQLAAVLGINKGDVYNIAELEKKLTFNPNGSDITSLYMDDGYLFFNIEPVEVAIEGDSVDIEMRIVEGPQATINQVRVVGNTRTSDHVILREIRTLPGQKFNRSLLIRTQREISTLGYFNPETVNPVPIPNPADGTVDIEYQVEERPSDQIELSGGWGGGGRNGIGVGFVGTLGVVFNNFSTRKLFKWGEWGGVLPSGDGQRLAVRFQASGRQYQTYSFSFTEPWLGGKKRNSFTLSLNHTVSRPSAGYERYYESLGYNVNTFGSFQISGASLSLGRMLKWPDDYFSLTHALSYQRYQLDNYDIFRIQFGNGVAHNLTFNTTIARNSVDNPIFPRGGSTISLSATFTPPYSVLGITGQIKSTGENGTSPDDISMEYHKWMFDSNWFTPLGLGGKLVLSARAHMGFIGRYNKDSPYTFAERFIMGGSGMAGQGVFFAADIIGLRGYQDQSLLGGPALPGQPQSGIVYNKFVTELRYLISPNPSATIFVLGFLEGGNNWNNYSEFNPFKIRRSAGIGARINMAAFGLLGIDYGWGFDPLPGQKGGQFHFTIGQQFR
ncbi:outer membrane protein assembly factor BamA [Rhodocytophaga aerolata]|uniref:Outer membrane protein assembly factor BamA n=1 Tax=Rhodocytophaga aerolata TaxID=455078 RepID=A0ABT8RDL1_9BACT|nr:outer membrane protein assembly factor BamA [Rhodocytophaga aerolata]MDO1448810.1 outer membrane protein assembly factor BamA [Rhodocytophaga aerolata]